MEPIDLPDSAPWSQWYHDWIEGIIAEYYAPNAAAHAPEVRGRIGWMAGACMPWEMWNAICPLESQRIRK